MKKIRMPGSDSFMLQLWATSGLWEMIEKITKCSVICFLAHKNHRS